jgi:hypothetical protein
MSDAEPEVPPVKKEKRKINEVQMANLRKGMQMMKDRRAAREEYESKVAKGEDAPPPPPPPSKKPKVVKVSAAPEPAPEVVVVQRKPRVVKPNPALAELAALRADVAALKAPAKEVVVEKVVEKPVDRIVEKTKVLSGSELLNSIFFK